MSALERRGLSPDPVIEHYKKDVDRTLLREHLRLTPQQLPPRVGNCRARSIHPAKPEQLEG